MNVVHVTSHPDNEYQALTDHVLFGSIHRLTRQVDMHEPELVLHLPSIGRPHCHRSNVKTPRSPD